MARKTLNSLTADDVARYNHATNMKMYLREVGHGTIDRESSRVAVLKLVFQAVEMV